MRSANSTGFTLTPPPVSAIRELDLIVMLGSENGPPRGELYHRCPIAE